MTSENYIKNMGTMQTIIKNDNGTPIFNNVQWNAKYDGKEANIKVDVIDNEVDYKVKAKLDNNDLARLLNIPSIKGDLGERLYKDYPIDLGEMPFEPQKSIQSFAAPSFATPSFAAPSFAAPSFAPLFLKVDKVDKHRKTRLVGKTAANKYKTPLPKTMRIHLTSASSSRGKAKGIKKGTKKRRRHSKKSRPFW